MISQKGKKYPKIKVLLVHPSKKVRDESAKTIETTFGCKVTTTTNFDRALNKLEKAASTGGPASSFHIVVSAYDISSPRSGKSKQGPQLVKAIRGNPEIKDISIILETANNNVKDIDANAFIPTMEEVGSAL